MLAGDEGVEPPERLDWVDPFGEDVMPLLVEGTLELGGTGTTVAVRWLVVAVPLDGALDWSGLLDCAGPVDDLDVPGELAAVG